MKYINITAEMYKRSVAHFGNPYRIINLIKKARAGENITYVCIGGSITQGAMASLWENSYPSLFASWLKKSFPQAEIKYINAGIGATGSLIGVHRLQRDVLAHNPDFVTVEFSVNEGFCDATVESYDNLVYNILNHPTKPAVMCIGMTKNNGTNAQEGHIRVAQHYDLPFISVRDAIWPEMVTEKIAWSDYSGDGIHPHDAGHKFTLDLITNYIGKITDYDLCSDNVTDKPLTNNNLKNARLYYVNDIKPVDFGCFNVEKVGLNMLPDGWVARENGAPMEFELLNCKRIYALYELTNINGGKAEVTFGDASVILDGDFKGGWGRYYDYKPIFINNEPKDICLKIIPILEDDQYFALVGLMIS